MESGFCVTNGIVALATKGVYTRVLIKKRQYWLKSVPGYITNHNFEYEEVGDVDMFEAVTEDDRPFLILSFKETDYVMKNMASLMDLDDMYKANTKCNCKGRDVQSLVKIFT